MTKNFQECELFEQLCLMVRDDQEKWESDLRIPWRIDDVKAGILSICLPKSTTLSSLALELSPTLSESGARALAFGIGRSKIEVLKLYNSYVDASVIEIIMDEGVKGALEALLLHKFPGCFSVLSKSLSNLKELRFAGCETNSDIQLLRDGLSCSSVTIEVLSINACALEDDDMAILARGLGRNSSLRILDLADNGIGDEGVAAFVEHWSEHSVIEEIELDHNFLGIDGAMALLNASLRHRSLTSLSLQGNYFGFEGIQMIAGLLPQLQLKELVISGCCGVLEDKYDELDKESYETAEAAGQAVVEGLEQNVHLQNFCPGCNCFPEEVEKQIELYLELNRCGRYLLTEAAIPIGLWSHVLAGCGNSINSIFFLLREQPNLMLSATAAAAAAAAARKPLHRKRQRDNECYNFDTLLQQCASKIRRTVAHAEWNVAARRMYKFAFNFLYPLIDATPKKIKNCQEKNCGCSHAS